MESLLWNCILQWSILFPKGIIMDAGANDGSSTVRLAHEFPNHTILSVEPILVNVANILDKTKKLNNVIVQHGGLGEGFTYGSYPRYLDQKSPGLKNQIGKLDNYMHLQRGNVKFPIFTVDHLVNDHTLSFAHWDVEGSEVELLSGAEGVIQRNRPIFTVESFHKTNNTRHNTLINKVKRLNYTVMIVNEQCGKLKDCRNYVCVPNESFEKSKCTTTTTIL